MTEMIIAALDVGRMWGLVAIFILLVAALNDCVNQHTKHCPQLMLDS
jgi:hypothetical protein